MASEQADTALSLARDYYDAWTQNRIDDALALVAPDVVCEAPGGRIEGCDGFRNFIGGFAQLLTGASMIAAFGDDRTALIMYDATTVPVPSAPAAEAITVENDKITHIRIIFDRAPFDAAQR